MKATLLREPSLFLCLAAFLLGLSGRIYAQDPSPTPAPTPDPLAGMQVQVLDQQQVTYGTHTITFNRIAPPVPPIATPKSSPQATPTTNTTKPAVPQAVSAKRALGRSPQIRARRTTRSTQNADVGAGEKPYKPLFLSATVYDHQFTEVRWPGGTEPALCAYLNLDFCYFTTVPDLEATDAVYALMFAWGNDTANSITQAGQPAPDFSSVPAGHAGYQVFAGDPNAHPDAIAALNALCAYYDANSVQMVATYNQQQAANAAHQQWLKDHPPVQPNTVINYWPVKNSAFLPKH